MIPATNVQISGSSLLLGTNATNPANQNGGAYVIETALSTGYGLAESLTI